MRDGAGTGEYVAIRDSRRIVFQMPRAAVPRCWPTGPCGQLLCPAFPPSRLSGAAAPAGQAWAEGVVTPGQIQRFVWQTGLSCKAGTSEHQTLHGLRYLACIHPVPLPSTAAARASMCPAGYLTIVPGTRFGQPYPLSRTQGNSRKKKHAEDTEESLKKQHKPGFRRLPVSGGAHHSRTGPAQDLVQLRPAGTWYRSVARS